MLSNPKLPLPGSSEPRHIRRAYRIGPSPIHGYGLFAERDLCPGEQILEYIGERISKNESIRRCAQGNEFIFYLDEQSDLDGNVESNAARFVNHSCSPNCEVERVGGQLWVIAAQIIAAGAEITFNYGYDLANYREHPCHCATAACVEYIVAEEFRDVVRCAREQC